MSDYTVTAEQLQELNVLINEGGQIPSAVNAATGQTAALLDAGKVPEAQISNRNASAQNDKSGKAWSNVQAWHDQIKNQQPPSPPPTESGEPLATTPADNVTYSFGPLVAGDNVQTIAGGNGRWSFSTGSGNANQVAWVNGSPISGTDLTPVKAGDVITFGITSPAWQANCTYSISLP